MIPVKPRMYKMVLRLW